MSVKWLVLAVVVIVVIGTMDFYCYTQAPYPQRAGIGKIPFIGGPLALIVYGRKKDGR